MIVSCPVRSKVTAPATTPNCSASFSTVASNSRLVLADHPKFNDHVRPSRMVTPNVGKSPGGAAAKIKPCQIHKLQLFASSKTPKLNASAQYSRNRAPKPIRPRFPPFAWPAPSAHFAACSRACASRGTPAKLPPLGLRVGQGDAAVDAAKARAELGDPRGAQRARGDVRPRGAPGLRLSPAPLAAIFLIHPLRIGDLVSAPHATQRCALRGGLLEPLRDEKINPAFPGAEFLIAQDRLNPFAQCWHSSSGGKASGFVAATARAINLTRALPAWKLRWQLGQSRGGCLSVQAARAIFSRA